MAKKFWEFKPIVKNEATSGEPESVELWINGTIADDDDVWLYEWFGMQATAPNTFRNELKQYAGKDITVWIDSPGGDTFAAAGIYTALKEHDGKVTVKIASKALSGASAIAMAGDEVLMSPMAVMMLHNPWTIAQGEAKDLRKGAEVLDTVKETLVNAYAAKTKKSKKKISSMMDDETWMSANVAVKEGFADDVLYADENTAEPKDIQDFAFTRLAVLNSADNAFKRLHEFELKINSLNADKNNGEKEETILDLKELKEKYPDLYNEAFNEGVKSERERMKAIDDLAIPGHEDLVKKAKYETGIKAEVLAVEIVKAEKQKGRKFLNDRDKDVEASNVNKVPGVAIPILDEDDKAKEENIVNKVVEGANIKRGRLNK
jgi:ATP-dependent Clp protease protease subunit